MYDIVLNCNVASDLLAIVNDITLSTGEGIVSPLIESVLRGSHGGYLLGVKVYTSYTLAKQQLQEISDGWCVCVCVCVCMYTM